MKSYTELSSRERLALTDEEIRDYAKRELLMKGTKITVEPEKPKVTPDDIIKKMDHILIFTVAGNHFANESDARDFVDTKRYDTKYPNYAYDTPFYVPIEKDSYLNGISSKLVPTYESFEKYSSEYEESKKDMKIYTALKDEYDQSIKDLNDEIRTINDSIRVLREEDDRVLRIKAVWDEYVSLANGDENIAKEFFVKAYGAVTYYDYIKEIEYEEVTN